VGNQLVALWRVPLEADPGRSEIDVVKSRDIRDVGYAGQSGVDFQWHTNAKRVVVFAAQTGLPNFARFIEFDILGPAHPAHGQDYLAIAVLDRARGVGVPGLI
jgi:hypothetical protein